MSLRLTLIAAATTQSARSVFFPNDEPLDQESEEKIRFATVAFQPALIAYTSPALRARQTTRALGLDAVVETALRDCDHGRWTGRSLEEIQTKEPDAAATWMRDPHSVPHGGESVVAIVRRVAAWFTAREETGKAVAVTHPAIIRAAITHVLEAPAESFWRIDVEPLRRTEFSYDGRRWAVRSLNSAL
jgi:broad specificity phosphatase PhoE